MKEFCVLKDNGKLKELRSLMDTHYRCNKEEGLHELSLENILTNTNSTEAKSKIKNIWYDIQKKINYEIFFLHNVDNSSKGTLPGDYSFILKIQPEVGRDISNSIYDLTGMELEILSIEV